MNLSKPVWIALSVGLVSMIGYAAFSSPASKPSPDKAAGEPAYVPHKKGTLTFARDIAPILYKNCATCHHTGEVAPFTLLTYQDAQKHAKQIAAVTQSRFMPPWKPDSHGEFVGERKLTSEQIGMIQQWAAEGAQEGPASALPPTPKFNANWALGEPDAIISPDQPYKIGAEGEDVYRNFVIPTHYNETRYVAAVDVRPGNRAIVHHMIAYIDTSGAARQLAANSSDHADGPGYTSFGSPGFLPAGWLAGWAPGSRPQLLPDGVGVELPKGADIVLQVHYHKDGKPEQDLTKIALYFSKKPVDKSVRVVPIFANVRIPANSTDYTTRGGMTIPKDVTLWHIGPHMHLLGKTMAVKATLPDGTEKPLIKINDWDFNWQGSYLYKEPIKLPAGTKVSMVATYDNSENNPRQPSHPPHTVTWGEQTTDEMCIAFLFYTIDAEQLTKGIEAEGFGPMGGGRHSAQGHLLKQFLNDNGK